MSTFCQESTFNRSKQVFVWDSINKPDIGELSRSFAVDDDTVAHTSPVEGKLQNSRLYSIITRM